jgi:hypothetical protein
MRQLIDMQALWRSSNKVAQARLEEHGGALASSLPDRCPFSVEDLVTGDFDFDAALKRLQGSRQHLK